VYAHKTGVVEEEIRAIIRPDQDALSDYALKKGEGNLSAVDEEALLRSELYAACARLAPYKRVKGFTVSREEFPKTSTRKIKRFEMARAVYPGVTS
jgi:long-chain acyl-CoA synthetase